MKPLLPPHERLAMTAKSARIFGLVLVVTGVIAWLPLIMPSTGMHIDPALAPLATGLALGQIILGALLAVMSKPIQRGGRAALAASFVISLFPIGELVAIIYLRLTRVELRNYVALAMNVFMLLWAVALAITLLGAFAAARELPSRGKPPAA